MEVDLDPDYILQGEPVRANPGTSALNIAGAYYAFALVFIRT